jgi:diguanylate cyclase (GGDEF)-like protein/PAS domain S-box-containing protein
MGIMDSNFFALITALAHLPDDDAIIRAFLDILDTVQDKVTCSYLPEKEAAQGDFEPVATPNHIFGKIAFSQVFSSQAEDLQGSLRSAVKVLAVILENRMQSRLIGEVSAGRANLEENLGAYDESMGRFFDMFPLSLWEEDFSQLKQYLDELRSHGVSDFRAYFKEHPEAVEQCSKKIVITDVNQYTLEIYGRSSKDEFLSALNSVRDHGPLEMFFEELVAIGEGKIQFNWEGGDDFVNGEVRYHRVRWLVFPGCERIYNRVIVAITDVTERRQILEALRESEERFSLAVNGANDGIWDWNLRTGKVYYSARWKGLLGFSDSEIGDSRDEWIGRVHPEEVKRVKEELDAHLAGQTTHFASEHRIWTRFGNYRWYLVRGVAVREEGQRAHRMSGSLTDINPRKIIEERLVHDAMHDPLTNLPNRAYFLDLLRRSIERARRHNEYQAAVLFLDLDRFRLINESLGHTSGDRLLLAITNRLLTCIRGGDCLARFGGDDFAILLDDINGVGDATRIATHIQHEMSLPFDLKGQEVFTSVSIGIVLVRSGYQSAEELLRDAETAMNRAKNAGRCRYQIFDPRMHAQSVALLQVEADLRRAIERQEFVLHYQPIISLPTGKITSVEALIRWQNPERGMILPIDFIPLAEETGLIQQIGEWILRTACTQARRWLDCGFKDLLVAINISPVQFQNHNLVDLVAGIIDETRVLPSALQLEVTESTAMEDLDLSVRILNEMNNMGVHVSIDDFGASYSSLGYLKRFPVNKLKIDLSFIRDIPGSRDDSAITAAMIAMGHIMDLGVVSEGVENEDQLKFLISRQCDEAQGFLFAQAMTADEMTVLLSSGRLLITELQMRTALAE